MQLHFYGKKDKLHKPLETHSIIRRIRLIVENYSPNSIIITETNIPLENLSYFEIKAHCIYNFSLAPLLIHAIISGSALLKEMVRSMPPAQLGNAYLNFYLLTMELERPLRVLFQLMNKQTFYNPSKIQYFSLQIIQQQRNVYEVNTTLLDDHTYQGKDKFKIRS